jgi:hypothetical protein
MSFRTFYAFMYILTYWVSPGAAHHQILSTPAVMDQRVETVMKRLDSIEQSSHLMLLLLHGGAGVQVGKDCQ